ncbi:ATP-binding protein [Streptomyces sp. NRRL F-525]|uniref:ATP-binding protein n=1 Tax=Streptomyces sp. NRRL F-525 TaxID=1463861 RepID=UPI0006908522|nr:ATP-binding protein [Streptomyces sp. NRRL F-525]
MTYRPRDHRSGLSVAPSQGNGPDTAHAADRRGEGGRRQSISLSAESLRSPATARHYTSNHLGKWGVPGDQIAIVEHIVSELVTNAVRHSRGRSFRLIVTITAGRAVVTVLDSGRYQSFAPRVADLDEEGGRGLALVEALADEWGHYPHRGINAVYAAVRLPAQREEGTTC